MPRLPSRSRHNGTDQGGAGGISPVGLAEYARDAVKGFGVGCGPVFPARPVGALYGLHDVELGFRCRPLRQVQELLAPVFGELRYDRAPLTARQVRALVMPGQVLARRAHHAALLAACSWVAAV